MADGVVLAFKAAIILYMLGAFAYLLLAVFSDARLRPAALALALAGFAAHSVVLGHQIWAAGRPPLSNMYEALILLAWMIVALSVFVERDHRIPVIGTMTLPVAVVFLGLASVNVKEVLPLMPSLRSNWLLIHVLSCTISYTAFAISFACGGLYLFFSSRAGDFAAFSRRRGEWLELLDSVSLRMVDFGFPFLTIGIATGSVWADLCWGTYWSWDPKETWSLVTWLVYAVFLHMRHVRSWRGRPAAAACVLGFASVMCTFVGVNYLFSSLHAYS